MEEVLARFPHLGDQIFQKLDYQTLLKCRRVNRTWKAFLAEKKMRYLQVIKQYTDCSDTLLDEVVEKSGSALGLVAVLNEIF